MTSMWATRTGAQACRRLTLRLIPAVVFVLCAMAAAVAQTAPAKPVPPAAALSPGEARNALAVLRDDKRRAELVATLDAIAKAAPEPQADPAAVPATPPATPPAPAPAKTAINPDSVGAQLAGRLSLILSAYAQQLSASVQSVNDLPQLGQFVADQAADPEARQAIADALLKLALVFAAALLGEWGVRRLLAGLRATLLAWAPRRADADTDGHAHPVAEQRRRRFLGALAALRQLPALFGRLLLDLLPVAAFAGIAMLLLGAAIGPSFTTRLVILQALEAYAYARVILAITAFLVSPETPRLRLIGIPDAAARFLTRWTRRIVAIGVTGWAVANIGLLFGMQVTAQMALLKLFMLVIHVCLVVAVFQARAPVAHRLRARRTATGLWARLLTRFAEIWHWVAIFYIAALWLVWAVEIRNGYQRLLGFCAVSAAIVLGGRLLAVLVLGGLDRLRLALADGEAPSLADRASFYYPFVRLILNLSIWFGTIVALFEAWGFPVLFWLTAGGLGGRVFEAVRTIVVAVGLAVIGWELMNGAIARHMAGLAGSAQLARAGRLRTLLPLLRSTMLIVIVLVVGMTVLSAIGVNIAPLLAGAGVIGIAVGFGSQKLVQDLITGLFLLLENAMQVGDVVTVAAMTGTVEALSIRTIRLRALDGAVHLIPFSAVTTVTNQTRDYSYALLDVSIGLNEEPAPIEAVLRDVAAGLRTDPAWQSLVLADLDVLGVEKLTDMAWIMRVRMKTQPGSRWSVARELNRRIKIRFDAEAIESPFTSHRVLSRDPPPLPAARPQEEQAA